MAKDITLESSLEFISKQSLKDLQKYKAQLERRLAVVTATINDVEENGKDASSGDGMDDIVDNGKKKRKAGRITAAGSRKKTSAKGPKSSTKVKLPSAPPAATEAS